MRKQLKRENREFWREGKIISLFSKLQNVNPQTLSNVLEDTNNENSRALLEV